MNVEERGMRDRYAGSITAVSGVIVGFAVAVGAFLGPLGWVGAIVLLGASCWFIYRRNDRGIDTRLVRLWIAGLVVGVLLYVGLALIQGIFGSPSSGSDSDSALAALLRGEASI